MKRRRELAAELSDDGKPDWAKSKKSQKHEKNSA